MKTNMKTFKEKTFEEKLEELEKFCEESGRLPSMKSLNKEEVLLRAFLSNQLDSRRKTRDPRILDIRVRYLYSLERDREKDLRKIIEFFENCMFIEKEAEDTPKKNGLFY